MYCNSCGSVIPDGQSFCSNCGAAAPAQQPVQQAQPQQYQQPVQNYQPINTQGYQQPVQNYQSAAGTTYNYQAPKKNGMATAGLVFAIISLVFCWLPFLSWLPMLLALIFSIVGIAKGKKCGKKGKAVAALIITIIAIAIQVIVFVGVLAGRIDAYANFSASGAGYDYSYNWEN